MNPLVVATTGVKLKSAFVHAHLMSSEFLATASQLSVRFKSLRHDEIALKTSIIKFTKIEQAEIS